MFDRAACAKVRMAAGAHVDLSALTALAALLGQALNNCFASSNAPLSGGWRGQRPYAIIPAPPLPTRSQVVVGILLLARNNRRHCRSNNRALPCRPGVAEISRGARKLSSTVLSFSSSDQRRRRTVSTTASRPTRALPL
jgi:hypothetical protein